MTNVAAPAPAARRGGYRWLIFAILALQYLLVYFHRVSPALMTRELTEAFAIGGGALGLLSSGYFYPYALMQLPVGVMADAWGARKTVSVFSTIGAVGAVVFALAPNFQVATLARVVVGLGLAAVFVPAMRICANWFRPQEYAGVSGLLLAMGGVGWFVAASPLAWMTAHFGWRATIGGIGVLTIGLAALTWALVSERPADQPAPKAAAGVGIWDGLRQVLTTSAFWPLAAWFFFFGGILFGFCGLWAGPYLMDVHDLTKAQAAGILSMIALGTIVGGPLLGTFSDRIVGRRQPVICGASLLLGALWIVLFALRARIPHAALFPFFFCFGVFGNGIAVVGFAAAKELFPAEMAGTAVGAVNFFAFLSAAVYQPLTGFLMDRTPAVAGGAYPPEAYGPALGLYLTTSLLLLGCSTIFREARRS